MPGLSSAQHSAQEPGTFTQAKRQELPLSSLQVQTLVNFPGSQAHTHLWIPGWWYRPSDYFVPLLRSQPLLPTLEVFTLQLVQLSAWNKHAAVTCPGTAQPSTDSASTWDLCWDLSCLLFSKYNLKSVCEYTHHTHSFGKMQTSRCPAAGTRSTGFARSLTYLTHPAPFSSSFFGTHIIPVPVSGV